MYDSVCVRWAFKLYLSTNSNTVQMIDIITDLHPIHSRQALKLPSPPSEVKSMYKSKKDFASMQSYQIDKHTFGMFHSAYDAISTVAFLKYGFYPRSWSYAGQIVSFVGLQQSNEIYQSIAWVLLLTIVGKVLGLPWSMYSTFVIEAKHGFNKTSPKTFTMDIFKTV